MEHSKFKSFLSVLVCVTLTSFSISAQNCPDVTIVNSDGATCDYEPYESWDDWETEILAEATNAAALANTNTGTTVLYSTIEVPLNISIPNGMQSDGSRNGLDQCELGIQTTWAYLLCFGDDETEGTADDSYILLGEFTLSNYPYANGAYPIYEECQLIIQTYCPDDIIVLSNQSDPDGIITNNNTNFVTYTSASGDFTGTVDVEIIPALGGSPCEQPSYTWTTPHCLTGCPVIYNYYDQEFSTCVGEDYYVNDWQQELQYQYSDVLNDPNVLDFILVSTVLVPSQATSPNGMVGDASHSGVDNCVPEANSTYAYVKCFGPDMINGTADDAFIKVAQLDLLVYPLPIMPTATYDGCTVTITAGCDTDVLIVDNKYELSGTITGEGTSTVSYTSIPGEFLGQVYIRLESESGLYCGNNFIGFDKANCPGPCPEFDEPIEWPSETFCFSAANYFQAWEMEFYESTAVNEIWSNHNVRAGIYYSSSPVPSEVPTPDGNHEFYNENYGCEIRDIVAYAYFHCAGPDNEFYNDDDEWSYAGKIEAEVHPQLFEPSYYTNDGCNLMVRTECENDIVTLSNPSLATGTILNNNTNFVTYQPGVGSATGTIDVTVTSSVVGNICEPVSLTIETPECNASCPFVEEVNAEAQLCMTGLNLSPWQTFVETNSNNVNALADANTASVIEYSTVEVPNQAFEPDGMTASGVYGGFCNVDQQMTYAYLKCFGPDATEDTADDVYTLLGTHTALIYPEVTAPTININDCSLVLTAGCANDVILVSFPAAGNGTILNNNTNSVVYVAAMGDPSLTLNYTYSSGIPDTNCGSISASTATPNCSSDAICPLPDILLVERDVCNGSTDLDIDFWQDEMRTNGNIAATLNDPNTSSDFVYSSIQLNAAGLVHDGIIGDGNHSGVDNCIIEQKITWAYIICFGDDMTEGTADDSYLETGEHRINIFPSISDPSITVDGCTVTVTAECEEDAIGVTNANQFPGNFTSSANTLTYTASMGDAGGTLGIDIVSNLSGPSCPIYTSSIEILDCLNECPSITAVDANDAICSGNLTTEISTWQNNVITQTDNAAAISDANTSMVVYSTELVPTETATPNNLEATGILNGINSCLTEVQNTYAYLLCFGPDGEEATADDIYLLLGTHTLNVYPGLTAPTIVTEGCVVTVTGFCATDVITVSNQTIAGGSISNNTSNEVTYTAASNDTAGQIDITVASGITGSPCTTLTLNTGTPECPCDPVGCFGDYPWNGKN